MDFKTLEEAIAHITELNKTIDNNKTEINSYKIKVEDLEGKQVELNNNVKELREYNMDLFQQVTSIRNTRNNKHINDDDGNSIDDDIEETEITLDDIANSLI